MKYQTEKALEIKSLIKTYVDVNGGKVYHGILTDISKRVGCSREYIRLIMENEGYRSVHKQIKEEMKRICDWCHRPYTTERNNQRFCKIKCRLAHRNDKYLAVTPCVVCGTPIEYYKVRKNYKPKYCNRICQGKGLAMRTGCQTYDLKKINKLRVFTSNDLVRLIGFTSVTSMYHLRKLVLRGNVIILNPSEGRRFHPFRYKLIRKI
jgi:hypothetical protein